MRSLKWIGQEVLNLQHDIRKIAYNLMNKVLRTPWPIHFKLRTFIGLDSLTVCILLGEISIFHSRVMGLYSSNCRRCFVCRAVNWEPLHQFTSNFVLLLIFVDFLSHNSWMKNLNFTNSCTINMNWNIYTIFIQLKTIFFEKSVKTINSNNSTNFEVNWWRGVLNLQRDIRKITYNLMNKEKILFSIV
jgi:hypothetical protein